MVKMVNFMLCVPYSKKKKWGGGTAAALFHCMCAGLGMFQEFYVFKLKEFFFFGQFILVQCLPQFY